MKLPSTTAAVAGLALASVLALAAERGYLGLSMSIDSEGFFLNPTLRTVTINKVAAASPAAKAGLKPGDMITEVEGLTIAGRKARELEPLLQLEVGQSRQLKIKRPSGETLPVTLVAAAKHAD